MKARLFIAAGAWLMLAAGLSAAELHVAPGGKDANPGSQAKPFATLERARDAARGGDTVVLAGGTYRLSRPLTLTPEHSGVTWQAAAGAKPVLTSAVPITGWRRHAGSIWVANVPRGWRFHFLFVDGQSLPVARLNKSDQWRTWPRPVKVGPLEPAGQMLTLPAGSLDEVPGNGDLEINLMPVQYWNTLSVVRDVNAAAGTLRRHSKSPTTFWREAFDGGLGQYNLENALRFLTQPGEWCVDSAAGRVYLWPPDGKIEGKQVWAPGLYRLLELRGDALGQPAVRGVRFRGLTFACTDRLPEDQWPDAWVKRQAELPDAMVFLDGAADCVIEGCTFSHSGSYGVALTNYAQGNRVVGNEMAYPGCGGVLLQGYGPGTTDVNRHNAVLRNYIHHTGAGGYLHSAAITLYQSGGNEIAYNWIDHVPYVGIQIAGAAWTEFGSGGPTGAWDSYGNCEAMYKPRWDELPGGRAGKFTRESFKAYLHSRDNRIHDNILTEYMNKMGDGGALYSWGCGTGNVWSGNLLCRRQTHVGEEWCFALYMDDFVDGATVSGNVAWHRGVATINKGANTWENNTVSTSRPAAYATRLAEITAQGERDGGWLARPAPEPPAPRRAAKPLALGTWVPATDVVELDGPRFNEQHDAIGWCEGGGSFCFGPYRLDGAIGGLEVLVGVDPQYARQKMHVRLDSVDGAEVGTFVFESTGGFEVFGPQAIALRDLAGEHMLYFVFEGRSGICNFKQFRVVEKVEKAAAGK